MVMVVMMLLMVPSSDTRHQVEFNPIARGGAFRWRVLGERLGGAFEGRVLAKVAPSRRPF